VLLKLYIYGYLNRIQSSRRLEREAQRNVELMWLTGRLTPDFKTIADFRRDNGPAIRAVCSQFVVLCRRLSLFTRAVVAIDGSKFKAVNNRDKNYTVAKVGKRMEQVEASTARYLATLDRADREEGDLTEVKVSRIQGKIAGLRRQMHFLKEMAQRVEAAPDQQVSLTDPDARSMATSGKGTGIVGYNAQAAVDAEHHLIVAHEVTDLGHDRTRLVPMGLKAQQAVGREEITVLADRGYFSGDQVLACEGTGVLPCVPKTLTSSSARRGLFTRRDFLYDAEKDHYTCPAGAHLTRAAVRSDRRDDIDHYRHLIPAALKFDLCPIARGDGGNLVGHLHEPVPSVAAGIDDGLVAVPHAVAQQVLPQELPEVLHRVQLRRIARQRQQADVAGHPQTGRAVPARAIEDEDGVRARAHPSADLGQVRLHGLEVHLRHDHRGADAPLRADRAEQPGPGVAPVAWCPRP